MTKEEILNFFQTHRQELKEKIQKYCRYMKLSGGVPR